MKKFTIFAAALVFYILHFTFYIPVALATDSTPSADLKAKLEQLKLEIASKAAKLKQEVNKKLQNKAYVGELQSKQGNQITILTRDKVKKVIFNQDSVFEEFKKIRSKFNKDALKNGQRIAALGDVDEVGALHAKKIILLPPISNLQSKTILWGQIISISDELVTLQNKEGKIMTVSATEINSKFKVGDFCIIRAEIGKNGIFKAQFLYVIPQGGILKSATTSSKLR